jgi:hypothetical protein
MTTLDTAAARAVAGARRTPPHADPSRSLEAYIPGDRRRALARGETLPDRVQGAGLFADISGFTLMTETFASELGARTKTSGAEWLKARSAMIVGTPDAREPGWMAELLEDVYALE